MTTLGCPICDLPVEFDIAYDSLEVLEVDGAQITAIINTTVTPASLDLHGTCAEAIADRGISE